MDFSEERMRLLSLKRLKMQGRFDYRGIDEMPGANA
jgi:hypothetical protein